MAPGVGGVGDVPTTLLSIAIAIITSEDIPRLVIHRSMDLFMVRFRNKI